MSAAPNNRARLTRTGIQTAHMNRAEGWADPLADDPEQVDSRLGRTLERTPTRTKPSGRIYAEVLKFVSCILVMVIMGL